MITHFISVMIVDCGYFIVFMLLFLLFLTSGSAMAEEPRDALVSRNSATTKHPI